jgi:uncharacterized protein YndB with AHSA1/START domain
VPATTLEFSRHLDLPPVIVWDALVDPALLEGWLAAADVDPQVGGNYDLRWLASSTPATYGRVAVIEPPRRLVVETEGEGRLEFRLAEAAGGTRGTSTALELTIALELEVPFARRLRANWLTALDQLEDLLRGHPVDWANWDRDHGETWRSHFREVVELR